MATFELIDDATYRVEGEITPEDVEKINAFRIRTNLVLANTKGQSSEIIEQISTDNVYFSILGGLDYFEKEKYNNKDYIERTYSAPKGLTKILQYFEKIESEMNPEWTDTQKCMYAYNALAVDTEYVADLEQDILSDGVTERGLNGVLYNQLTCAGMAQTFKEMMDRIGIKCYYQNQKSVHAFNVVELDGKLRGIDVTWDCTKNKDEKCSFNNFGRDPNFYQKHGHRIAKDSEETVFDLTTFSEDEILENYKVIEGAINERSTIENSFRNFDRERKIKFLPVDKFKEELEEEGKILIKIKVLKQLGVMPNEFDKLIEATKGRYGFVADYVKEKNGNVVGKNDVIEEIQKLGGFEGGLRILNDQLLLKHKSPDGVGVVEDPMTPEQCKTIIPALQEDVTQYYTKFFEDGVLQIDEMIETLNVLDNMPPEIANKTATLRAHIYTKVQLFAKGEDYFKKIGMQEEQVEMVNRKTKEYLDAEKEKSENEINASKHENDLDFLYAIIQSDIIDITTSGRDYSEEDFEKLINNVRNNWKDSDFSNKEYRDLLDEALGKTIKHTQVSKDTINSGAGLKEINAIASEIRKTQTKDIQQEHQK